MSLVFLLVSVLALDEFQDLRKKYENELECRKQAEEYASEVQISHIFSIAHICDLFAPLGSRELKLAKRR